MQNVDSLIKSAIKYHDSSSQFGHTTESKYNIHKLNYIYKELSSQYVLHDLLHEKKSSDRVMLSSFILDNITEAIDHDKNNKHSESIARKNKLSIKMDCSNYFELFCKTRATTQEIAIKNAFTCLNSTESRYSDFMTDFPSEFKSRKKLSKAAKIINNNTCPTLKEFQKNDLLPFLDKLKKYGIQTTHNLHERVGVTFNIEKRSASINLVSSFQAEHLRALFHALGHSFFFFYHLNNPVKIISSDTTETELWAIYFENFLSSNEDLVQYFKLSDEFLLWQEFLNLYYSRLYAVKTLFEAKVYQLEITKSSDLNLIFKNYYEKYLFIDDDIEGFLLDEKPVAIEFLYSLTRLSISDEILGNQASIFTDAIIEGVINEH